MSKVGRVMGQMAESTVKAGGVVTKKGGEAMGSIAKTMGVSEDTCAKMEDKAESIGESMYYESGKIKRKVESFSDEIANGTKKTYESIKNKMK